MNAGLSWSPTDNMRVWRVCVSCVHTVGLLTCGNIATEVSCGCDDIILPAAMGIP